MKNIPGLSKLPIIGGLHNFLPVFGTLKPNITLIEMCEALNKKFGPVVKIEGLARGDFVFLFEPDHIEKVYRGQEENPLRPGFATLEYFREKLIKSTFEGVHGLTSAQGAEWRSFRTKVNPALLKINSVKLYSPGLGEIATEFIDRLQNINDNTYIQDNFYEELQRFSLESVSLVALGTRIGCLRDDLALDHPARRLTKSVKDIMELTYKMEMLPHPWRYIPTRAFKDVMEAYSTQWNVSTEYIQQAQRSISQRNSDVADGERSMLEKLLAIDEKVAIVMASEMLMAGIDTVTVTIIGLMYLLAKNPEKQMKLREELRSSGGGVTNRRYLKACIKESLRLQPVVSAHLRRTTKEHTVGGYTIPEGIDVIAPMEYLSKLEKHYPRPLEFIPERWLVEKSDPLFYGHTHPMVTIPFGYGIRSCIGRRIAELEIEIFFEKLIEKLAISWEGPPINVVNRIITSFAKPYYFKFEKAI